jgi:hypothetical protein
MKIRKYNEFEDNHIDFKGNLKYNRSIFNKIIDIQDENIEEKVLDLLDKYRAIEVSKITSPSREHWIKTHHYLRLDQQPTCPLTYRYTNDKNKISGKLLEKMTYDELKKYLEETQVIEWTNENISKRKYFFAQDQDSHWYMIPLELKSQWTYFTQNDMEDDDIINKFQSIFNVYLVGGGISDISFENPISKY